MACNHAVVYFVLEEPAASTFRVDEVRWGE